jgi:hypothetical protein
LVASIALMLAGLSLVFIVVLLLAKGTPTRLDLLALATALPEAAVLGAVGVALSAFSTPTLGTGLGLGVWLIGASTDDFVKLTVDQGVAHELAKLVSYAFPALARLNFREAAVYGLPVPLQDYGFAFAYGLLYCAALVGLASTILSRREML